MYNMSGAAGALAVSCLCPGSSKIVLAAEGKKTSVEMRSVLLCVLVAEGFRDKLGSRSCLLTKDVYQNQTFY